MIRIRRILAVLLVISFFFNTTAVLAVSSYNVDNTRGVWTISIEKEKDYLEKEKERLQKKFLNIKEQMQGTKVYESFFGKNQTLFKFREELTRFFNGIRQALEQQWDKNFTNL